MSSPRNMGGTQPWSGPAYRQLYEQLRESILTGQLRAGSKLPASRHLASEAGLSRNTVLAAFEQLRAEGYLEGRRGSGTYVADVLPEQMLSPASPPAAVVASHTARSRLSRRGQRIAGARRMPLPSVNGAAASATAFQIGLPALDEFPTDLWSRLHASRTRQSARELMRYDQPAGYEPLREAIASYIAVSRGVRCTADQVVVVAGSQQALEFCARVLLDPGDRVWVEDPGYLGARAALISADAEMVAIPVDDKGIDVDAGSRRAPDAKMAIVTPSHQFPLGGTLPVERRLQLLEWARQHDSWVVEDDYDCEFRYVGRPLTALQAIDQHERVIYVGTFSKILFPGLRLGYLIAPLDLVDAFAAAHTSTDMHSHLLDQAVLADFMRSGQFTQHLRRMRVLYGQRQAILLQESRRLGNNLRLDHRDGGLHLVGWLSPDQDDQEIARQAAKRDLHVWPLSLHCLEASLPPGLLLGYAGVKDRHIRQGLATLATVLRAPH